MSKGTVATLPVTGAGAIARAARHRVAVVALGLTLTGTALMAASSWSAPARAESLGPTASTSDTLRLTLSDAISRSLANSPGQAAIEASRSAAEAAARGARAAGLPSLDVSAGYTRYSDVPEFGLTLPGGPTQVIFPNIPDAWRARVNLTVPVFTGGRLGGYSTAARNESEAARNDVDAARADLVLATTAAYWNLRTQRQSAGVLREALAAYDAHLVDARNRSSVGLAARNEVLAVEVERDRAELGLLQADGAAAVAEANLRRLLGAGDETPIVAIEEPGVLPRAGSPAPARKSMGDALDSLSGSPKSLGSAPPIGSPADPASSTEVASLVAIALASRPERAALAARLAAAQARARAESGARWPQLAAVAGYDYANPNRRITPPTAEWKDSWDASLNVSLSLFDSGRISAATARARAQAEALRQQTLDLDRRIRLEVTTRAIELRTAELAVRVSERAVESGRENEKVTRDRYREGVASSSDLLDAEVRSLRAALDRTDAQARLMLARANLERSLGSLR